MDKILNFEKLKKLIGTGFQKYKEGLDTGNCTFKINAPNWNDCNNGHINN
jgi:hypothetical protein